MNDAVVTLKWLYSSLRSLSLTSACICAFFQGEIAYNCGTCQVDPTCVQCQQCFQLANHEGHDVYFHRTSLGGCCDCGDVEAWAEAGFCPRHRKATEESSADVLAALPPAILAACGSDWFPQAVEFVADVGSAVRRAYGAPDEPELGDYHVVVHNDDVHTYDDVSDAGGRGLACRDRGRSDGLSCGRFLPAGH